MNIFPLSLNYIRKLPYTIPKALSCFVDYIYHRNNRTTTNGVVKLSHFMLVSVSEQAAPLIWRVMYAENTWKNFGRRVVKSHVLGTCDEGGCCMRFEVCSSQFCSGVRSSAVWYCVSGLVSIVLKEQSAFICKVWGVEQSSRTSQPLKRHYKSPQIIHEL